MRVAILAASACERDAVGDQIVHKVQFLRDRNADVRLFVHTLDRLSPSLRDVAVEARAAEPGGPVWAYLLDCDLVLVEFSQHFPLLEILPLLSGRKPRVLVDYYGITPAEWAEGALRQTLLESAAQRGLVAAADGVLTHSQFSARELTDATGIPVARMHTIDLPILGVFEPGEARRALASRLALGKARVLLFVGRLAINKSPQTLIDALPSLGDLDPPVHAVFVGDQGDVYGRELRRCQERARDRGVADRVHFLGQVALADLLDAYRSADLLVMPSRHEGFCLPVREAMACGLPVLAARAGALPETVGAAGLTFAQDDPDDLAAQVRRVLCTGTPTTPPRQRIAIASFRFGAEVVGGAERSLLAIAQALKAMGRDVEIFTTCNRSEGRWSNELPAGARYEAGLLVHRFPIDKHDAERHRQARARVDQQEATPDLAEEYLASSLHSTALLNGLAARLDEFDAIITGPYPIGLTAAIVRRFAHKTLLLPCFHDEPLATLPVWPRLFGSAGGLLFHSPEEQTFVESSLGVRHPNAGVIGTYLPQLPPSTEARPLLERPYVVYCGRYCAEKGLDRLLDYAARYRAARPDGFDFVFMGEGGVRIPREAWACDLGRADEARKAAVLAGAAALVQLSRRESLSLVVLEAWRAGTPVVIDCQSAVLRGQVERSKGGLAVDGYQEFAAALDTLWADSTLRARLGRNGQQFVAATYGDEAAFARRVGEHIEAVRRPIAETLRARGLEQARRSGLDAWRLAFGAWIDEQLHAPRRPCREELSVKPAESELAASLDQASLLVPVMLENRGTHPAANRGPGRTILHAQIADCQDNAAVGPTQHAEMPAVLAPGQAAPAAFVLRLPDRLGHYHVKLWSARCDNEAVPTLADAQLFLTVEPAGTPSTGEAPYLKVARWALAAAQQLQRLPDDYEDVTEGWFKRLKRWVKAKLLGNFRRGYVDVLSRQQSQVNQQLVLAVQQLTHCCATLSHALESMQRRDCGPGTSQVGRNGPPLTTTHVTSPPADRPHRA